MCTAEDQCVNFFILQFLKVSGHDLRSYRIMKPSFLDQRNKQRTCLAYHCDLRIKLFKIRLMNTASDSSKRSDHADSLIACLLCSNLGSCFDHSKYRDIQFILHCIQGKCTCRVAGDHDCLDLLLLQKMNDLSGIADDCILGFTSIRNSRRIAKINDLLRWKISHDLPGYGKTAYSGIKYTDRCISVYFHKSISPVLYVLFAM